MEAKSRKSARAWRLGDHILIQGDSTQPWGDFEATKGVKIRLIACDPPYGVGYVENKDWLGLRGEQSEHFKNHKKIAGDQLQSEAQYAEFTKKWLEVAKPHLEKKNACYIFNCDLMLCALKTGMKQAGLYYSQTLIWLKDRIVLGRKDYNPQHELIAYGWYGTHIFERPGAGKSVLFHPKPHSSKIHPTMKPVGLMRKLILNSTKVGEWVYDPFGGSGSTLIACEHTKRRCIMIESEETYCDSIIKRWELLTKKKSERI